MTQTPSLQIGFDQQKIGDVPYSPAIVVDPDTPVGDVVRAMQKKRCGCAIVCDATGVRGTFTERHVLHAVVSQGADLAAPVSRYMNPDAPTLSLEDRIDAAIRQMDDCQVRHLPIYDGPRGVVGVLSVRDVINLAADYHSTEVYNLPPRLRQRMDSAEGA